MPTVTDSVSTLRISQGADIIHVSKRKAKVKTVGTVVRIEWDEDWYVEDVFSNWTPTGASAVAVADAIAAFLDTQI